MIRLALTLLVACAFGPPDPGKKDASALLATVEALQEPIQDFRCEYEGTMSFKGKIAEYTPVGEGGLYESFSGDYVWKRGGDIRCETLNRRATDGLIMRNLLLIRMAQQQAEEYARSNDAPLGYVQITSPGKVRHSGHDRFGSLFLIDDMKKNVADEHHEAAVVDGEIDGRPMKVLEISLKGLPDSLIGRYWIDLRRSGQVVKTESYTTGKVRSGVTLIELAPFTIGKATVWMPVALESKGYVALENKQVIVTKEPTSIIQVRVVSGTMEFNKHPGADVFTTRYKPGTPISDGLKKLQYEYGQQSLREQMTKPAAEKLVKDQVAAAEKQKSELVAATSQGIDWASYAPWLLGAAVLASSILLWRQRHGR